MSAISRSHVTTAIEIKLDKKAPHLPRAGGERLTAAAQVERVLKRHAIIIAAPVK
jgi:hypothetical protein